MIKKDDEALYEHPIPSMYEDEAFLFKSLLEHGNFITTASVVFRKPLPMLFPDWFLNVPFGDQALYKIIAADKRIGCLNEFMSVYRIHPEGIYQKQDFLRKKYQHLDFYKILLPNLHADERAIIIKKKRDVIYSISKKKYPNTKLIRFLFQSYLRFKY
tara:strand:+ start:12192 stop:12665 length:474 start_codon:yes stop_codon:yes gene_type:complete